MLDEIGLWMDEATDELQLIIDNMTIAMKELKKDKELKKKHKKWLDILDNAIDELDTFTNAELEIEVDDEDIEDDTEAGIKE